MALIGVQEPRRSTPRFDLVLCRHVPPVKVLVLKNSPFDLMTRTALIVREPSHRSDPQSVESPNGPGNPSGCCDPTRDLRWQPPGFAAGTQGRGGNRRGAWPSSSTKTGASETSTATRPATPSREKTLPCGLRGVASLNHRASRLHRTRPRFTTRCSNGRL